MGMEGPKEPLPHGTHNSSDSAKLNQSGAESAVSTPSPARDSSSVISNHSRQSPVSSNRKSFGTPRRNSNSTRSSQVASPLANRPPFSTSSKPASPNPSPLGRTTPLRRHPTPKSSASSA